MAQNMTVTGFYHCIAVEKCRNLGDQGIGPYITFSQWPRENLA